MEESSIEVPVEAGESRWQKMLCTLFGCQICIVFVLCIVLNLDGVGDKSAAHQYAANAGQITSHLLFVSNHTHEDLQAMHTGAKAAQSFHHLNASESEVA